MAPQERVRTTKACVACSIRKIKCDGQDPCTHCIRFFDGECFYTAAKKRGPPKGCPARGGHRKRKQNEAEKFAATAEAGQQSSPPGPGSHPATVVPALGLVPAPSTKAVDAPTTYVNNFDGTLLSGLGMNPVGLPPAPDCDQLFSPQHSLSTVNPLTPPRLIDSIPVLPGMASYATYAGLTSEGIDDVLLVFETFIHPHWPVIYIPALQSLRSLETQHPLVFDAILAVSAAHTDMAITPLGPSSPTGRFSSGTGRPMSAVCDDLTDSVRQRILVAMNSRDYEPNLQTVQALIMISLVDFGSGRTSLAYQMCGFASRMAIDLQLHIQNPELDRTLDARQIQERSRTLWACFIQDKMLAAVAQRSASLPLADIDIPRPSIMERDELDLWLSGEASRHFLQPHTRPKMESIKSHTLSSFNSWADIMAILEKIIAQVYRPTTRRARMEGHPVDGYEDTVIDIDADLQNWRQTLPAHLQWSDDDDNVHANVGLHLLTCRGWYYICLLLLHRPQVPYLDTTETPNSKPVLEVQSRHAHLPNGADASRYAATSLCTIMEAYESTFRMRKFASSWVYLVFQAATVHAGLASHPPSVATSNDLSPYRAESLRRLEQCTRWLDQIAQQWSSAGRHVEILRNLSAVGARTRPPSPAPGFDLSSFVDSTPASQPPAFDGSMADIPLDVNAWMTLWASMPTAGADFSLWQQCFPDVSQPQV